MTDETAGRPRGPESEGPGLDALTEDVLPALIARLRVSRLGELEVRTRDWRIRLRRDPRAGSRTAAASSAASEEEPDEPNGGVARSSAVGYFTPARDLVVGHSVQAGDVLGSIDVLGIAQEVTAPADGIIAAIMAEDGQAVEYGQALAEIDPLELDLAAGEGEDMA